MENQPASRNVGRNVRRLRQNREWGLAELSRRLGELDHPLSVPVLSKMELGDRGIDVNDLVALGEALEVAPVELIEDPAAAAHETMARLWARYQEGMVNRDRAIRAADSELAMTEQYIRDAALDDPDALHAFEQLVAGVRRKQLAEVAQELLRRMRSDRQEGEV